MDKKHKPFDKESGKKIPFEELVKLIGQNCDYRFAIIDYDVDDELKAILLIPYIIKCRDKVEISNNKSRSHKHKTFIYRKIIGEQYVCVEEIRIGRNKSLAFQTLYKRSIKKPPI